VSRALILTYHAIEPGPAPLCGHPDLFRAHVDAVLASGARVVSISELVGELASPTGAERLVALTFDDAFASVLGEAAPVLVAEGLPATAFCVAGHLGGRNDWSSDPAGGFDAPLVSAGELTQLVSAGFEIGSHGFAHLPLSEARGAALERELVGSKEALEHITGTDVRSYAYPYGASPHPEARNVVRRTYAAACTTRVALAGERSDPHALPRVDAHYLRRPELLQRAAEGSLGAYLVARRFGSRARRAFRNDYVSA
jgi:peptidoglycan/xylan/chitin deacetylase (PgdA/CDA1 family)